MTPDELTLLRQIAADAELLLRQVAMGTPALQVRLTQAVATWRRTYPGPS